jgi:hypothetical protein
VSARISENRFLERVKSLGKVELSMQQCLDNVDHCTEIVRLWPPASVGCRRRREDDGLDPHHVFPPPQRLRKIGQRAIKIDLWFGAPSHDHSP